jgi:type VI protein secretion system component Hcp
MAIFMKHPRIAGEVTADGYQGWVELTGLSWSVARGLSEGAGASSGRDAAAVTLSDVACARTVDIATIPLLQESLSGRRDASVQIHLTVTGADGRHVAQREITLSSVQVTSYQIKGASSDGSAPPQETFTLSFTGIENRFQELDRDLRRRRTIAARHQMGSR